MFLLCAKSVWRVARCGNRPDSIANATRISITLLYHQGSIWQRGFGKQYEIVSRCRGVLWQKFPSLRVILYMYTARSNSHRTNIPFNLTTLHVQREPNKKSSWEENCVRVLIFREQIAFFRADYYFRTHPLYYIDIILDRIELGISV